MDSTGKDSAPKKDQDAIVTDIRAPQQLSKLPTLTDRFGNSFYFGNAGDYWHVPFDIGPDADYRRFVRNIRDMTIREDDILICSFPKTGLHWHQEMLNMLMHGNTELMNDAVGLQVMLDAKPVSYADQMPSPRIMVTHVPFRYIPRQALEKKIKILYLVRNPKDILVSFYKHMHESIQPFTYPGTFEHFFYLNMECGYMYGDIFDYLMDWQTGIEENPDAQIYTSVYEDMKADPVKGVEKLNEFFGTRHSKELCHDIAAACSFDKMKPFKEKNMPQQLKNLFKDKTAGFYRKGEVGDWKNWFTAAMDEFFDAEFARRMSGFKIAFKF